MTPLASTSLGSSLRSAMTATAAAVERMRSELGRFAHRAEAVRAHSERNQTTAVVAAKVETWSTIEAMTAGSRSSGMLIPVADTQWNTEPMASLMRLALTADCSCCYSEARNGRNERSEVLHERSLSETNWRLLMSPKAPVQRHTHRQLRYRTANRQHRHLTSRGCPYVYSSAFSSYYPRSQRCIRDPRQDCVDSARSSTNWCKSFLPAHCRSSRERVEWGPHWVTWDTSTDLVAFRNRTASSPTWRTDPVATVAAVWPVSNQSR